jgi:hypothetical protein
MVRVTNLTHPGVTTPVRRMVKNTNCWTPGMVHVTNLILFSRRYAEASADGTAAAAAAGAVLAASWEACDVAHCTAPPAPPLPPPPPSPPSPDPPWHERPALMGGVFGSIGGALLISGAAYAAQERRRTLDRQELYTT